jgi:DNA-directed RNA polymerase subunit RPC12/RpoP
MPETITRKCRNCNKEFSISPQKQEELKERGMQLPSRCPSCRSKNRIFIHKTCKVCGECFSITELEREWFVAKGFNEPERCLECRIKRREARKA